MRWATCDPQTGRTNPRTHAGAELMRLASCDTKRTQSRRTVGISRGVASQLSKREIAPPQGTSNPATSRSHSPHCPILTKSRNRNQSTGSRRQYVERVAHNARAYSISREAATRFCASC